VTAYDEYGNLLATVVGGATNQSNAEFIIPSSISGIAYIDISANLGADSETVDDLSYTVIPEPSSFMLLGTGLLGLAGSLRRKFVR
jgi:hypothetical protein